MSYAQGVLAFLAALLPILASLYAGASFLREQYLLRWERRTRNRIKRLGRERLAGAEARASVRSKRLGVHVSEYDEVAAFETLMLAAHGLSRPTVTHSDVDLTHSMAGCLRLASRGIRPSPQIHREPHPMGEALGYMYRARTA